MKLEPGAITGTVYGRNVLVERVPVLASIHMEYRLRVPDGSREIVERALSRHASRCPSALSLRGAVEVTWSAEVEEGSGTWRAQGSRD